MQLSRNAGMGLLVHEALASAYGIVVGTYVPHPQARIRVSTF